LFANESVNRSLNDDSLVSHLTRNEREISTEEDDKNYYDYEEESIFIYIEDDTKKIIL
jgi:hypothetical protein